MAINPLPNRFLLSNKSSPVMPCGELARVSRSLPFSGIDLDTQQTGRLRIQRWSAIAHCDVDAIATCWVSPAAIERGNSRLFALFERLTDAQARIIVDCGGRPDPQASTLQLSAAIKLRMQYEDRLRVALAIRPYRIESTRSHLNAISALRLHASEWDLDLALDLSREIDWLWEAEAAIYRLTPKLTSIRMGFPTQTFDGRFRTSISTRTLNAASEMGYSGTISIVIPLPFWHWRNARALEASGKEAAARIHRRLAQSEIDGVLAPDQSLYFHD
jgi:hypothetical protein